VKEQENKPGIGYKKCLVYYFQSINRKARTSQIMTPYSLNSTVNYSSSCQDISNYNSGIASAALKQGNLQALQALLNYN
jgi:hypothetical protein